MTASLPAVALFLDPPSHHFLRDRLFDRELVRHNGNDLHAPYVLVRDFFASRGVPVHTADYLLDGDAPAAQRNLYVSMGILRDRRDIIDRPNTIASAFFVMECPIVEPSLYRALGSLQQDFRRIFSWSDSASLERFVGAPLACRAFHWPQALDRVAEPIWSQTDRKFLVMINANKRPRLTWQELYSERVRAVEFFSRTDDVDLYGVGWDDPPVHLGRTRVPYTLRRMQFALRRRWHRIHPDPLLQAAQRVYRGATPDKLATLGRYTFALCFENMILRGWITEKIFDCFFSGTVPVYWGAPDIAEHVPADCFIDMRAFASYAELHAFLKGLSREAIAQYRQAARAFLESPRFRPFAQESFLALFREIIAEDAGVAIAA